MYDLKIRKIPEDVIAKLREEAKKHHMKLEPNVRALLADFAMDPERITVEDRYKALVTDISSLCQVMQKESLDTITKNTYVMEQLLGKLEEKE